MVNLKRIRFVLILFLSFPCFLRAQMQINVEIRPRSEYRNGYKMLAQENTTAAFFTNQRSRISLSYNSSMFQYAFSVQDVRVWGDETLYSSTGVMGDAASVDVHEAWLQLKIGNNSALKLGRQVFKYDDERLLAARNWNQHALSYDALCYKFQKEDLKIDVAVSLNNQNENIFGNHYSPDKMKTLNFIHLQKLLSPSLTGSLVAIASGYTKNSQSNAIYVRTTFGTFLKYQTNGLNISTAGYYQTGKNEFGMDVSAFLLSLDMQKKLQNAFAGAGVDLVSGHDCHNYDINYRTTDHHFDLLYGARHRFYGNLDYFSNLASATYYGGLIDLYLRLGFDYSEKGRVQVDYHHFFLQNNTGPMFFSNMGYEVATFEKNLGSEFDFSLNHQFNENINVKCGYSFMLPTDSLEMMQHIPADKSAFSSWGWVMLTFKHQLFKKS